MLKTQYAVFLAFLFAMTISFSVSAGDKVYTGLFSDKAVSGYDPVSFFTAERPEKGREEFTYRYQEALWLFQSEENRRLFIENPEKYAPRYGGFCAWAVAAKNARAPGNPKYWRVVDGKLYLNYSKSVQAKWLEDVPGYIERADRNWPTLLDD